jgi:DNA repair exonuclease SbcCD ATPase subunit
VWLIKGTNNDAFGSNGAGKSTLLEALQQCLYNRTQNGNTLDTTINRKTGKAYDITVTLSTSDGDYYEVNNNRSAMKITIKKLDGDTLVDVGTRSMVAALSYIQNLIGLDFSAFVALTHVTHSTVVNMIDNFTGSNLLKVLLDFGLIQKYEKALKDSLNQSVKTVQVFNQREVEINKSLSLVNQFKPEDTMPLYKNLNELRKSSSVLQENFNDKLLVLQSRTNPLTDALAENKMNLNQNKEILKNKVCGTCGTDLSQHLGIDEHSVKERIRVQEDFINLIEDQLSEIKEEHLEVCSTVGVQVDNVLKMIQQLEAKIEVQEYNTEMFNKSSDTIRELQEELISILKEKPRLLEEQDILQSALAAIKQGKLHEGMLNEFCRLNNIYLKELMPYVSIDYLHVSTKHNKNSFNFVLIDSRYDTQIEFTELSGGELTRVRLVVLLAMLKTVQVMTNTSVNILIFDEALDTLDASAAGDLANLFRYLSSTENKFISLVSHGQQLNSIDFTGTINVVKTEGTTKVLQEIINE